MDKVSVIIPVHNGEKFIKKTVKKILNQTFKNIEVILVENFSSDNSLQACKELKIFDSRVNVIQSFEKGTSLARKKGVEHASGKYILFSDQDDRYINNKAIEEMYKTIVENEVEIVQFGYIKQYNSLMKRNIRRTSKSAVINREQIILDEIKGLLCDSQSLLSVTVWDKIYNARVLKESVKTITESLFFAEDLNLNAKTFLHPSVKKVLISPDCYYVWSSGIGFSSSSNSSIALMNDYEKIKPSIVELAKSNGVKNELFYKFHLESVYFCKVIVDNMIKQQKDKNDIINVIDNFNKYSYVNYAKDYLKNLDKRLIWQELEFLINCNNSYEYYEYCLKRVEEKSKISSILEKIKGFVK